MISQTYRLRKKTLEELRPFICLKFYHQIAEKLQAEEQSLQTLLHWKKKRQVALAHYSLLLPPAYFEQKFFSSKI